MSVTHPNEPERRRAIRRSAWWLALLALAFYVAFIAMAVMKAG